VLCNGDGQDCPGWSNNPQGPAQALDSDLTTRYTSGDAQRGNEELVASFPAELTIDGIEVLFPYSLDTPAAWAFEYSLDGVVFRPFDPPLEGGEPTAAPGVRPSLTVAFAPTAMKALKMKQTGQKYGWFSIVELNVTDCRVD
jgi:hypothetical protein